MSLVKQLQAATGKQSLWEIVKKAGLSIALDGNWGESVMHSGSQHTRLVGEDSLGNKYYEDPTRQYGRHRWVVFSDMNDYNASQVAAQWHGWLHCITDDTPATCPVQPKKFEIAYFPNASGTPQRYMPKGSWDQGEKQRNWRKFTCWVPGSQI